MAGRLARLCTRTRESSESATVGGKHQILFTFDAIFSQRSFLQRHIYNVYTALVVKSILEGYNGTVFTYRQTGSGKMHTMEGATSEMSLRRVIPNAFEHIFDHIALNGSNDKIPCADIML